MTIDARLAVLLALTIPLPFASAGCAPNAGPSPRPNPGTPGHDAAVLGGYDAGVGGGGDAGSFQECAAVTTTAESGLQPVDVIWVVDRSGSMRGEADIVQTNINNFAGTIATSGIDVHVVMISDSDFVAVPPPLGADAARFRYIEENVQSHDGLSAPLERFGDYADFLRPDAATHFVVVTDDESRLGQGSFRTQMEASLGHTFTFHTIASPPGSSHCDPIYCAIHEDGCTGPNGDAADNGQEYWDLSGATGGQTLSICTADWTSLFGTLTAAIAVPRPLPCRYGLPEPPTGMSLDRGRVNVIYTPTGATQQVIPNVGSFSGCAGAGWYYEGDDIVMCPATCSTVSADASGQVEIALGCATVII
ncbi:MAG: hypothetical protein AB7S26_32290 [Sandaracinaceae bacterium]